MKVEQKFWTKENGFENVKGQLDNLTPQIVFVFGGREELEDQNNFNSIKEMYPESRVLFCSTAGEILDTKVNDNTFSITAVHFEKTELSFVETDITDSSQSEEKGKELAEKLKKDNLVHAMVFSDGLLVNGTGLVEGITKELPKEVSVTGGLVGDGANFKKTVLGLDELPTSGKIVLIGFHSGSLKVGYGSLGGWDSFGPVRLITKSKNNVLYELDGRPALELYKEYLGEEAKGLPGSGLLFPINLKVKDEEGNESEVVRTLLAVSEEDQSMTFAGDMPEGTHANLMKANFDKLVEGARGAAKLSGGTEEVDPELAILISCIGRKLVLKDRIEEETEAVRSQIGEDAFMTGFYSYGEISPVAPTEKQCKLHNQTMTITTFKEE